VTVTDGIVICGRATHAQHSGVEYVKVKVSGERLGVVTTIPLNDNDYSITCSHVAQLLDGEWQNINPNVVVSQKIKNLIPMQSADIIKKGDHVLVMAPLLIDHNTLLVSTCPVWKCVETLDKKLLAVMYMHDRIDEIIHSGCSVMHNKIRAFIGGATITIGATKIGIAYAVTSHISKIVWVMEQAPNSKNKRKGKMPSGQTSFEI